jgi:site-specific recombinase XerC
MPASVRAIRREHVESYVAHRRLSVAPATLSVEYRALAVFWNWAVDEDEIDLSPMSKMSPPRLPDKPVPVVPAADFLKLLNR